MPVPVTVELFYDGDWHDHTSDVRVADPITITRGKPSFGRGHQPAECQLSFDNRSSTYSPRNPSSPLYRKIGRWTRLRVTVDGETRFVGAVPSWPVRAKQAGTDVWVPVTAYGPSHELAVAGSRARAQSAYRRYLSQQTWDAWWPMEEGPIADGFAPVGPGRPLSLSRSFGGLAGSLAPWLGPAALQLPNFLTVIGQVSGSSGDEWAIDILYRIHGPRGDNLILTLGACHEDNSNFVDMRLWGANTSTPNAALFTYPNLGTQIGSTATISGDQFKGDVVHHIRMHAEQSGSDIVFTGYVNGEQVAQASRTGTLTPLRRVQFWYLDEIAGPGVYTSPTPVSVGHLVVYGASPASLSTVVAAARGYQGEPAHERVFWTASDEGLTATVGSGPSAALGPQTIGTGLEAMIEAADSDEGYLLDARDTYGFTYVSHGDLLDPEPVATLDFAGEHILEFELADEPHVANVYTVKRDGGGESTVERADGPLGTDALAAMPEQITISLATDRQALQQAAWRSHTRTWDEPLIEKVSVDLVPLADAGHTSLVANLVAVDAGDVIRITNPPAWAGAGPIDFVVDGYTETVDVNARVLEFHGHPAGPYHVGVLAGDDVTGTPLDTDMAILASPVTAGDTVIRVLTSVHALQADALACQDEFDRTVPSGWGSTPDGREWETFTTSGATFSVSSGTGRIAVTAAPSSGQAHLPIAGQQWADVEARVTCTPATSDITGASVGWGLVLRVEDGSNSYYARATITTAEAITLAIFDLTDGSTLAGPAATGITYSGQPLRMAFRAEGTALMAKIWNPSGSEPSSWLVTTTDSDHITGTVGVRCQRFTGNTNTDLVFAFDDFEVRSRAIFSPGAVPYDIQIGDEVMTVTAAPAGHPVQPLTVTRDLGLTHPATAEVHIHRPLRLSREEG